MQYKEASTVQEEPEGTVREESQITSGGGVSPDSSTKVVRSLTPARRTIEVIYLVFTIVDVVLLVRMVLKVLAANPHAGFTSFIYSISDAFLIPFRGILPATTVTGKSVFELSVLFAIVIYALVAFGLTRLVSIAFARSVVFSHRERTRDGLTPRSE
ncbi:MAG TPA: YggT family protein [Candidatus Acidoferrum sp.]|jgi:uncharacterized protein YggT (Ycf19 family)|nr:YggT family protein [Candidatus Acidoferrum sp.]